MKLINKINSLDKYCDSAFLINDFIILYYDLNGWDLPPRNERKSIDEFEITQSLHVPGYEVLEETVKYTLKDFKLNTFNSKLAEIKELFEREYFLYPSHSEKTAYYNALNQALVNKLKVLKKSKEGSFYEPQLKRFIDSIVEQYSELQIDSKVISESFKYREGHPDYFKISVLFKTLIDNHLIGEETILKDFAKIFQNLKISNKIRWIGDTSELKQFIKIINSPKLNFFDNGGDKWKVAENCFIKMNKSLTPITQQDLRTYKITSKSKTKINDLIVVGVFNSSL